MPRCGHRPGAASQRQRCHHSHDLPSPRLCLPMTTYQTAPAASSFSSTRPFSCRLIDQTHYRIADRYPLPRSTSPLHVCSHSARYDAQLACTASAHESARKTWAVDAKAAQYNGRGRRGMLTQFVNAVCQRSLFACT
jgi:hypothetical protein